MKSGQNYLRWRTTFTDIVSSRTWPTAMRSLGSSQKFATLLFDMCSTTCSISGLSQIALEARPSLLLGQLVINLRPTSLITSIGIDVDGDNGTKAYVDASFTPSMKRTATLKMKNSEIGFPTVVFQVAYRHQPIDEFENEVVTECLSMENSIQVFIGLKIYDDKKFQVLLVSRGLSQDGTKITTPKVRQVSDILPTDKVTNLKMRIAGKSLLWGCDEWKDKGVEDFMLDVESLRFALRREN